MAGRILQSSLDHTLALVSPLHSPALAQVALTLHIPHHVPGILLPPIAAQRLSLLLPTSHFPHSDSRRDGKHWLVVLGMTLIKEPT